MTLCDLFKLTFEVILQSIHKNFDQNRFINVCVRTKKIKFRSFIVYHCDMHVEEKNKKGPILWTSI